jgi:hypothetical protein
VESYLRTYVEDFLAIAFFRLPDFRNSFTASILEKSDNKIEEWSSTSWNIDKI